MLKCYGNLHQCIILRRYIRCHRLLAIRLSNVLDSYTKVLAELQALGQLTPQCIAFFYSYTALTEKSVHHALLLLIRTSDCMMTDAICRGSVLVASYCIPGLHVCNAIAVWDYVCMHVGGACMSVRTSAN